MIYKILFIVLLFHATVLLAALKDPTMPVGYKITPLSTDKIQVTGIIRSKEQAKAYINNQLVTVGDSVAGYEVMQITDNQVFLSDNKGNYVVSLIASVCSTPTDATRSGTQ